MPNIWLKYARCAPDSQNPSAFVRGSAGALYVKDIMMLTAKLADHLEVDGWDIAENLTHDLEWWADEIWHLKSRWSPVGAVAFVTFLVDPQWRGNRRKGEGIWAVGCSARLPRDRTEAASGDTLSLKASKEEIEEFVEVVASFRQFHGNV